MNKTIFQKIVERELPAEIVYEDESIIAFLDIKPVNKGHTLVVTKKPYKTFDDIPQQELPHFIQALQIIARGVIKSVHATSYNLITNCGEDSGQIVPHVHFHIIPRFHKDEFEQWQSILSQTDQERKELSTSIAQELQSQAMSPSIKTEP